MNSPTGQAMRDRQANAAAVRPTAMRRLMAGDPIPALARTLGVCQFTLRLWRHQLMSYETHVVPLCWWDLPLELTLSVRPAEPRTPHHPGAPTEVNVTQMRLVSETDSYDLTDILDALTPAALAALTLACRERTSL